MDGNRQAVDQTTLHPANADLEDTQISAIISINQISLSRVDGIGSGAHQPNVLESDRQGRSRQADEMAQQRALQVGAVFLQISEHLFNPHSQPCGIEL